MIKTKDLITYGLILILFCFCIVLLMKIDKMAYVNQVQLNKTQIQGLINWANSQQPQQPEAKK